MSGADINTDLERTNPRWKDLWVKGINIGDHFDTGTPSPYLLHLIKEKQIPEGRALVPGCGRGYDVIALASPTRTAYGLDLVEEAVASAKEYCDSLSAEEKPAEGRANFICGSFFDLPTEDIASKYNFIYDYTFLCALNPSIRTQWAAKMADLVAPGGELLTLIYPIRDTEGGPPFSVNLELVRGLLEPVGFECMELKLLPPEMCHPGRDGSGPNGGASGSGRWRRKA